jgi:putative peptide zinc metalloprotease protein
MEAAAPNIPLPPLREDIRLIPGEPERNGAPAWVLQDPARNRFFRIGWAEFELLRRWRSGDGGAVIAAINKGSALQVEEGQLRALLEFLAKNQLLQGRGSAYREQLAQIARAARPSIGHWLLHRYLFFRIPLVRPHPFLQATWPWVAPLFSRSFLVLLMTCGLFGVLLAAQRWESFSATFLHFQTLEGWLMFALALSFAKVIHELGHAYMATRFGLRVPTMGVAFLVMWPVLYTENSEAWKLPQRRKRLLIGGAGMLAELALAVFALLLWSFVDDGPLRSALFMLATSTWVITLLINLNPFMRFDGYYLLSDLLGIANLQDRAFALGRWQLREWLFGLGRRPPEQHPPALQRFLIWFAWGTWIYRFFLFLGIALLVYHLFFKALGLFLMLVEIGWFILRPLTREVAEWLKSGEEMRWNRQSLNTLLLLATLLLAAILPWDRHSEVAGLVVHPAQSRIFAAEAGRISELYVVAGQSVTAGEPLLRLASPDLEQRVEQARKEVRIARLEMERKALDEPSLELRGILEQRLAEAESSLEGLQKQAARLEIRAPQAGRIAELEETLAPGRWIDTRTPLLRIVDDRTMEIQGYLSGSQRHHLRRGAQARFYPENPDIPPLPLALVDLEEASIRQLPTAYLASTFGGPLAVREGNAGSMISEHPLFRATFRPLLASHPRYTQIVRGEVRVEAEPRSPLLAFFRHFMAVLVRESGF